MFRETSKIFFQIVRVRKFQRLFSNFSKGVLKIEIKNESSLEDIPTSQNYSKLGIKLGHFCLIHFASYSAARKTLETLKDPDLYQVTFFSTNLKWLAILDEHLWENNR